MMRARMLALFCAAGLATTFFAARAQAENAYGQTWGRNYNTQDWNRFYHYPFVYYPQNFYSSQYYKSSDDLYYRYPQEMRQPV
ncbi:MAG TPA: calmodulin-binding protein, partial [Pirellulales bacterium]|nr:calmodulin-binding protein [Pirellulales bacterium]